MTAFLQTYASRLLAFSFFGLILVVSMLECVVPRRPAARSIRLRWFGNFTLGILVAILNRLLFPVIGVGFARLCEERGWGLLNHVHWPWWCEAILTVLALDLSIYAFHYLSHRISFLWRLHRLHHTDEDVDFTTALRIHPLAGILGSGLQLGVIALLGAPAVAILIAQLLFIFSEFFSHANVNLPESLDRIVRWFTITPDMHRLHHSQIFNESNSNLGNFLPWWDRIFGSYLAQPSAGQNDMLLGLPEFRDPKHQNLLWMLAQPFLRTAPATDSWIDPANTITPIRK